MSAPGCVSESCPSPGTVHIFWPGREPQLMCISCAIRAGRVAEAMGFGLTVELLSKRPRFLEGLLAFWSDTEARSAEAHAVYQTEAHRRGDVRHPDAYADLSEATKEWDRVLVRWVAETIRSWGES